MKNVPFQGVPKWRSIPRATRTVSCGSGHVVSARVLVSLDVSRSVAVELEVKAEGRAHVGAALCTLVTELDCSAIFEKIVGRIGRDKRWEMLKIYVR